MTPLEFKTVQRTVNDLIPLDINPRKITEAKRMKMIESLQKFNLVDLPVIDSDNTVISGHQRLRALQAIGRGDEVIDVRMPNRKLTDKEVKEYNLLANTHFGEFDFEILESDFIDVDFSGLGMDTLKMDFDSFVMGDLENPEAKEADNTKSLPPQYEAQEDDFETPEIEEVKTDIVLGDLIEFKHPDGRYHRLLCEDSTKKENVERLMNGEKADMVFTDPPYRMEVEGGSNQPIGRSAAKLGEAIKHLCDFNPNDFLNIIELVFNKNTFNAYIFCNKDLIPDYLNFFLNKKISFNLLFWKKPSAIPLGGQHRPDVEYIIFLRKNAIWNNAIEGVNYSKCLEFNRENSTPHPTMKPISLISNELKISSNLKSIVFDFFLGSGSTMVASHQLHRNCYGMELDEKYCQVIVDRMRKLDPDLVIFKNGIEI